MPAATISVQVQALRDLSSRFGNVAHEFGSAALHHADDGSLRNGRISAALENFCTAWQHQGQRLDHELQSAGAFLANTANQMEAADNSIAGHAGVPLPGIRPVAPGAGKAVNPAVVGPNGPQHFRNGSIADVALKEVGTKRPTGWNQPGECVKSVQRWITQAGGHFGGGGVVSSYVNAGAVQVTQSQIQPGDVIQYTSLKSPDAWNDGVHTVVVVGTNPDGTLHIVQSNAKYDGVVTEDPHWSPHPPTGFEPRVWRFGEVGT